MEKIAERIVKGLKIRGMRQADLVEKTGIGKSSISTYISGAYEPKQRNIYKIAKALDVNEAWLMGYDVPMEKRSPFTLIPHKKQIPILGRISAGLPLLAVEHIEGYENVDDESLDYGLIVKGDSMIGARIFENDVVYVTKDIDVYNGDIVIALINGYDATIKRFYQYDDEIILKPENPTMKEQHYKPEDVRLLGKVKQVRFNVE